jgi:hypothetical protein
VPTQITLLYGLKLLLCVGAVYALFHSYGRLFSRFIPPLATLPGGFILFLAANELLALPFILLHLPFKNFFWLFCLVNGVVLAAGMGLAIKQRSKISLKARPSWYLFLPLAAVLTCMVLTQFYVKYDADDSFYVSLTLQNDNNPSLYSSDPSSGNPALPFPKVYQFQGGELFQTALAKVFRLSALEIAHGFMPLMIIPLVFLAFRSIFREFLDRRETYVALLLLFLFFLFGGYSYYSQGTALLTRVWQGKAILAALLIPLLLFLLYKVYSGPKERGLYLAILLLNIAGLALNPSAVYLFASTLAIFGLLILVKAKSLMALFKLVLASLPVAAGGLYILLSESGYGGFEVGQTTPYRHYLDVFLGNSWFFYIGAAGLVLFYRTQALKRARSIAYYFPLIAALAFLNPLVAPFIIQNITRIMPALLIVPMAGALAFQVLMKKFSGARRHFRAAAAFTAIGALAVLFAFSGRYVFDRSLPLVAYDNSRQKVPAGVAGIGDYLARAPHGVILAVEDPAAYLHNFTTKHELIGSRSLNLTVYYRKNPQEFSNRRALLSLVNNVGTAHFPQNRFHELIEHYRVDYLVFSVSNGFMDTYLYEYGGVKLYENHKYILVKTSRLDTPKIISYNKL